MGRYDGPCQVAVVAGEGCLEGRGTGKRSEGGEGGGGFDVLVVD